MVDHLKIVDKYCRDDFYASGIYKKYNSVHMDTWCSYQRFDIIDNFHLKISYKHGYGDFEYSGSYIIMLTDEYRDKRISDILSKNNI